ncbi:MAG: DUF3775 domain-containing protein [Methylocella sp.]
MAKFRYAIQAAQTTAKDMLSELNPEKVCFIIIKLRELDVQAEEPMGDSSNATDDGFASVFTQSRHSSVRKELVDFIGSMNEDEQRELIALYLIGGEDFPVEEWPGALAEAAAHPAPLTAAFLLGVPTAAGQLEEGLALFGFSCEDVEEGRL